MKLSSLFAAAAVASLLVGGPALAQTTAPAAKSDTAAAPASTEKTTRARSPESAACSKQADEKGLKGRERRKFRRECIRNARGGEKAK